MNCKYSYTKDTDKYGRHFLYCSKDNEVCPYVRYCPTIKDIKNTDNYKCDKKEKTMQNKVRFEKGGYLYVELGDSLGQVIKIKNPLKNVPKFIDLIINNNEYFVKGYEPKEKRKMELKTDDKKTN